MLLKKHLKLISLQITILLLFSLTAMGQDSERKRYGYLFETEHRGKITLVDQKGKKVVSGLTRLDRNSKYNKIIPIYRKKKTGILFANRDTAYMLLPLKYDKMQFIINHHYILSRKKKQQLCFLDKQKRAIVLPKEYDKVIPNKAVRPRFYVLIDKKQADIYFIKEKKITHKFDDFKKIEFLRNGNSFLKNGDQWYKLSAMNQKSSIGFDTFHVHKLMWPNTLVKQDGKWGVMEGYDSMEIRPTYDSIAFNALHSSYRFFENGRVGLISSKGKLVVPAKYDDVIQAFTNEIYIKKKNKYHLLIGDQEKQHGFDYIIQDKYLGRKQFVVNENKQGVYDPRSDTMVLNTKFDSISLSFAYGGKTKFLIGELEGKRYLFDVNGVALSDSSCISLKPITRVSMLATKKDGTKTLVMNDGSKMNFESKDELRIRGLALFDQLFEIIKGTKKRLIFYDTNSKSFIASGREFDEVLAHSYHGCAEHDPTYFAVRQGNQWLWIDGKTMKPIFDKTFDQLEPFNEQCEANVWYQGEQKTLLHDGTFKNE